MTADWILQAGLATGLAAIVLQVLALKRADEKLDLWSHRAAVACAVFTATGFFGLVWSFVTIRLGTEVVFLYTGTDVELRWRIAGAWTGTKGSLLLWTMWTTIAAALYGRRTRAKDAEDTAGPARRITWLTLLILQLPLLWAVAWQGTFVATPQFLLDGSPTGNGLNPTLKSTFILIHPPMMFMAYALTAIPAAAAIGHLWTGHNMWSKAAATWARLDWMLYTIAIGLGAMWAYVTLNFGGYWAWDPVEVANLLPWLGLSLYLHAQVRNLRDGSYPQIGPMLALLPWLLTLFSTLSTRSGLWVSVHAFTDPTNTFRADPLLRFQDIMASEPSLGIFVSLVLAVPFAVLGLWSLYLSRMHGTWRRFSQGFAAFMGLCSGYALVAPASATSALFELSYRLTGGRSGLGLLALMFGAFLLAGLPALTAPETERRSLRRPLWKEIGTPRLARYAVLVLGTSLLVMWLWHMVAARGWSTEVYEARVPWLALPALLGLIVFQGHRCYGRRRSVWILAGAVCWSVVAAALWAGLKGEPGKGAQAFGGGLLLSLSAVLVWISIDQVRRGAVPAGANKKQQRASLMLFLAALLNLVFWLDPPSTLGWGAMQVSMVWPWPILGIVGSLYGLFATMRLLAGAPPRAPWHVPLVLCLLGGFLVAPLLAIVGYRMLGYNMAKPLDVRARRSLHRVAVYGIHLAVALALLGYATTTVLRTTEDVVLAEGQSADVGPVRVTFLEGSAQSSSDPVFADRLVAYVDVERTDGLGRGGMSVPTLEFEERAGGHFPTPAILRLWDRDINLDIDTVMMSSESRCSDQAIAAYETGKRACTGDAVGAVRMGVTVLPGLDLLWAGVAVMGMGMGLLLFTRKDV